MRLSPTGEIIAVGPGVDLYMDWIHISDGPGRIGTRAEWLTWLPERVHGCPSCDCDSPEARLTRADETGSDWTGSLATTWENTGHIYLQRGVLPRSRFEAFARAYRTARAADAPELLALLDPFDDQPDQET